MLQVPGPGSSSPVSNLWSSCWLVLDRMSCTVLGISYGHKMDFLLLVCFPDMWAMGAIMAELLTLRPLFPGSRY